MTRYVPCPDCDDGIDVFIVDGQLRLEHCNTCDGRSRIVDRRHSGRVATIALLIAVAIWAGLVGLILGGRVDAAPRSAADSTSSMGAGEVNQQPTGAPLGAGVTTTAPGTPSLARQSSIRGEASWYDDGRGLYGAVHSWRFGDQPYWVEVCRQDASATCVLVLVRDHMANPRRAIDLSPDAFVRLWPGLHRADALGRGVVDVTARRTGAIELPQTDGGNP
jgi:hypothetical protein